MSAKKIIKHIYFMPVLEVVGATALEIIILDYLSLFDPPLSIYKRNNVEIGRHF